MIIEEILRPQIFLDMDGVLTDFHSAAVRLTGKDSYTNKELWTNVSSAEKKGHRFFESLKPMRDAKRLLEYLRPYDVSILSSAGTWKTEEVIRQKRSWLKKYFPELLPNAKFTSSGSEKAIYSGPNRILIDDWEKNIDLWRSRGGIGILHKSATDTIQKLKRLGL